MAEAPAKPRARTGGWLAKQMGTAGDGPSAPAGPSAPRKPPAPAVEASAAPATDQPQPASPPVPEVSALEGHAPAPDVTQPPAAPEVPAAADPHAPQPAPGDAAAQAKTAKSKSRAPRQAVALPAVPTEAPAFNERQTERWHVRLPESLMTAVAETETRIANTVGMSRNEIRLAALWAVLGAPDHADDFVRDTMPAWLKARSRATQQRNGTVTDEAGG